MSDAKIIEIVWDINMGHDKNLKRQKSNIHVYEKQLVLLSTVSTFS